MTKNNETKFTLVTKDSREAVLQRNGKPFIYSSRELATMGKRALETDRKTALAIVSV